MALSFNSVKVNLEGGSVIYLMNHQIVSITGSNGAAVIGVDNGGEGLKYYNSTDDITTAVTGLLALCGNFITLSTPNGDVYLNAFLFKGIVPSADSRAATATIEFTSGAGTVTDFTYNSVSIFDTGTPVSGASLPELATNFAAAVNSYTSTPNYTAVAAGSVVYITLDPAQGAVLNGTAGVDTVTSTLVLTNSDLDGGVSSCNVLYDEFSGTSVSKVINSDSSIAVVEASVSAL